MEYHHSEQDYEKFEIECRKIISTVLIICETELVKRSDNDNVLPHAAIAVRESLLTFLALTKNK
jgi:hypothetical protein